MSPCSSRFQSTHPRGVRRARHFHFGPGGLVSIHAPAWGATRWAVRRTGWNTRFQSTHPRGVRLAEFKSFCATCMAFQSTHPRGVRQGNERAAKARALLFQSTHPRGVRHAQAHAQPCAGQSFNPRTRVGCDRRPTASRASSTVSIHAPAWGATSPDELDNRSGNKFQSTHPRGVRRWGWRRLPDSNTVSIHAPAWGATMSGSHVDGSKAMFQSTHPRGVRLRVEPDDIVRAAVSIHAPAWGATCSICGSSIPPVMFQSTHPRGVRRHSGCHGACPGCFNPRTRVGCDGQCWSWRAWASRFQSTHPRGVRLVGQAMSCKWAKGFNPRTRVGCDQNPFPGISPLPLVSIHAPAWGATSADPQIIAFQRLVSIHAPAWGATGSWPDDDYFDCTFQSTHPRGVRPDKVKAEVSGPDGFQSTHPRGVRQ